MRVRHYCHHCNGLVLRNKQCGTCSHHRCVNCIRYPRRRVHSAKDGADLDRQFKPTEHGALSTRIPTDDNATIGRIEQKTLLIPQEKEPNWISRECTPELIMDSGLSEASGSPLPFLHHIEQARDKMFFIQGPLGDVVVAVTSAQVHRHWQTLHRQQQSGKTRLDSSSIPWEEVEVEGNQESQLPGSRWISKTLTNHTYGQIEIEPSAVSIPVKEPHHGKTSAQPSDLFHESSLNKEQSVAPLSSSCALNQKPNSRKRTDEDDDQNSRKRPKNLDRDASHIERNILRCPYAAYDAARYSHRNTTEKDYRTCSACFLTTIPRLK